MSDEDLMARWAPTLRDKWPVSEEAMRDEDLQFRSDADAWEESVGSATPSDGPHTGVMVAFFPEPEQARQLALDGGEAVEELHLTLAFLGEVGAELVPTDEPRLVQAVTAWASAQAPIEATASGLGIFHQDPPVTYASIDAPDLPTARQSLVEALQKAGVAPLQTHGFTPHMTLAYADARQHDVPRVPMRFDKVVVAFAGNHTAIPLGTAPARTAAGVSAVDRPLPLVPAEPADLTNLADTVVGEESARAFVATINGHTLVTAPAATLAAHNDFTVEDISAQHMLYMHGRFVGAEAPNRNGAFWSAGDLELGLASVMHGPLNWLHEARHVIGTIAQADFVTAPPGQQAAEGFQPHITATAAIWRWVYPDEAYVVQQASDQGQLWYSMECISKEVSCVGEAGCGNTTTYAAYMAGAACEHVRQRASVRRFVDPVFLGGAVIVPPTRPGWAEADARVMKPAEALAEAAFEQAGRPDISASEWEQLMAQLVRFAQQ